MHGTLEILIVLSYVKVQMHGDNSSVQMHIT